MNGSYHPYDFAIIPFNNDPSAGQIGKYEYIIAVQSTDRDAVYGIMIALFPMLGKTIIRNAFRICLDMDINELQGFFKEMIDHHGLDTQILTVEFKNWSGFSHPSSYYP